MSNEGSLLSHIAGNFISQYENVANSSVAYLLNRYPACRRALSRLIDANHVPANYVTERMRLFEDPLELILNCR